MLSNRHMERSQTVSTEHQLSIIVFLFLSHQRFILFICCSFIYLSLYNSLNIYIAWGPCYAALLITILLIGRTEAAVRDGSHALQLNLLQHVHVATKTERGSYG